MLLPSLSADFSRDYAKLSKKVLAEIQRSIYALEPHEIPEFIRGVFKRNKVDEKTQKLMLEYIAKGAAFGIGAKSLAQPATFAKVWLNRVYDAEGVTLSSRLHDLTRHVELIEVLQDAMRANESWGMAAQAVFKKGIQSADVAEDVKDLMQQARKLYRVSGDLDGYAGYKVQIRAAQRRIDRLINPSTSKLKRAYQSVLDITEESSRAAVTRAAHYAEYFKEKYNTERLFNTNLSRAYGQSRIVEMQSNEDVIACHSMLNSQHQGNDICDFYANADLYGMGPGVFPKNHLPPYPYHPWCMCKLIDVYAGEVEPADASDFDPKEGEKYLKSLSADERKELLGKAGAEAFKESPNKWRDYLKSYNDPERVTAKISKEVLYGKD